MYRRYELRAIGYDVDSRTYWDAARRMEPPRGRVVDFIVAARTLEELAGKRDAKLARLGFASWKVIREREVMPN